MPKGGKKLYILYKQPYSVLEDIKKICEDEVMSDSEKVVKINGKYKIMLSSSTVSKIRRHLVPNFLYALNGKKELEKQELLEFKPLMNGPSTNDSNMISELIKISRLLTHLVELNIEQKELSKKLLEQWVGSK